ncbi:class I SAM-dependent methyltransferase [Streptomyces sp. NPDC051211]|uniref:class I SAM-dependent methyltransferase n=1 Tax=Streptomyces sp. NPDC051211 TaxID=3154643 RepID=UPI00344D5ED0
MSEPRDRPTSPGWYATPTVQYAVEPGFDVAPIEAYVRTQTGRYLNPWYKRLQHTYAAYPGMYGEEPSTPALHAASVFRAAGASDVPELGAGHGRDALYFAREGFTVQATDFSATGLQQLQEAAGAQSVERRVTTAVQAVRDPLPLPDACVDAVFAYMLLYMALSTQEIQALVGEIRRVLRPAGEFVYTVRHTGDAHYGAGTAHGDDIYEHGGFAVHFFDRGLVDALADGWTLNEVHSFEEGDLPRRLWRVTQTPAGESTAGAGQDA